MKVEIPEFIKEVKLSNKRIRKFFKESRITAEKPLPLKYQNKRYIWKKGKLWDKETKEFVTKNSKTVGTPRFIGLSGNLIMRLEGNQRDKVIVAIKKQFRPYLADLPKPLPTPLIIELHLYDVPGMCKWDLDNKWIYNKCFQDLLQDEGYIANDNVSNITGSPGVLYFPVQKETERKLVFILKQDERTVIVNHNMFYNKPRPVIILEDHPGWELQEDYLSSYHILEHSKGKPGELEVEDLLQVMYISTGRKKILYGAVRKALGHVFTHCIQFNLSVSVRRSIFEKYEKFFQEELIDRGIQLYIYGSRDEVYGGTQDVSHQVHS